MADNLCDLFEATTCAQDSERTAITCGGRDTSFRQLRERAWHVAGELNAAATGDNVGVLRASPDRFVECFFGALLSGHVPVPLNPLFGPDVLRWVVGHAQVAEVLTDPAFASYVGDLGCGALMPDGEHKGESRGPWEGRSEDKAAILYTSGTEGRPKGVVLSHANLVSNAMACREAVGMRKEDVVFGMIPLFHSFGMTTSMILPLLCGARSVFMERFSVAGFLEAVQGARPTCIFGIPSMFRAVVGSMKAESVPEHRLRLCIAGGERLDSWTAERFRQTFGVALFEGYGLTEASPVVSTNRPGAHVRGTVGKPLPGVEVRVVDGDGAVLDAESGELEVAAGSVMQGYYKDPAATQEAFSSDGWLKTGDIAQVSDDGFVTVLGRKKEIIICAGENVSPAEIEEVLCLHPAVAEAVVGAMEDDVRGEVPKAYIVRNPGGTCTETDLKRHCAEHLPSFKVPHAVSFWDAFPHGPTGKVNRKEVMGAS